MDFERILKLAIDNGASDVHLQSSSSPMLRLGNQVRVVEGPVLTDEEMLSFLQSIAPKRFSDDIVGAAVRGLDFAHALPSGVRFRCSAFRTLGRFGTTMRAIRTEIPSVEALSLPKVIHDIALARATARDAGMGLRIAVPARRHAIPRAVFRSASIAVLHDAVEPAV